MPVSLIRDVIQGYASTAKRMMMAGLDGVEVVASHGYLPSQFLNPRINRRTDDYGGSFENRLRFMSEVAAAVRGAIGHEMTLAFVSLGMKRTIADCSLRNASRLSMLWNLNMRLTTTTSPQARPLQLRGRSILSPQ